MTPKPLLLTCALVLWAAGSTLAHAAVLENPGNGRLYSGIGVISGWKCEADGDLTVRFNDGESTPLAYLNDRPDTQSVCGNTNNGFVAVWNRPRLMREQHDG